MVLMTLRALLFMMTLSGAVAIEAVDVEGFIHVRRRELGSGLLLSGAGDPLFAFLHALCRVKVLSCKSQILGLFRRAVVN